MMRSVALPVIAGIIWGVFITQTRGQENPVVVSNCPNDIEKTISPGQLFSETGIAVSWDSPVGTDSFGNVVRFETTSNPGDIFYDVVTVVTYSFFVEGQETSAAQCSFTVLLFEATCHGEFLCGTGECIQREYVCDIHPDCSDGTDISFWFIGPVWCQVGASVCQRVTDLHRRVMTSFDIRNILSDTPVDPQDTWIPWTFNTDDLLLVYNPSLYLTNVELETRLLVQQFSLDPADPAPAFYMRVKTTQSLHDETLTLGFPFALYVEDPSLSTQIYIQRYFRVPLPLELNEGIEVLLSYTPDFLDNVPTIPVNWNSNCPLCIRVNVASVPQSTNDCRELIQQSETCVPYYYEWDDAQRASPDCVIEESARYLRDEFDNCLVNDVDQFTVFPGETAVMQCNIPSDAILAEYNRIEVYKQVDRTGGIATASLMATLQGTELTTSELYSDTSKYNFYFVNTVNLGVMLQIYDAHDSDDSTYWCVFKGPSHTDDSTVHEIHLTLIIDDINECTSSPCRNGGFCVDGINMYTCLCVPGYGGATCEININECASSPCLNGGFCVDGINMYICVCVPGYGGPRCEINFNECASSPCRNSGICFDGINRFSCQCAPGYDGTNCEININECASFPCMNGGFCSDGINRFTCQCAPGWDGTTCENNINDCASSPCRNGGSCLDGINRFTCQCVPGLFGLMCEINVDECGSSPCVNGDCFDSINQFRCQCATGWTGAHCDTRVDPCLEQPCLNGGSCAARGADYVCECLLEWSGNNCEINIVYSCGNFPGGASCLNDGTCYDDVNGYMCYCSPVYYGNRCENKLCKCISEEQGCGSVPSCPDALLQKLAEGDITGYIDVITLTEILVNITMQTDDLTAKSIMYAADILQTITNSMSINTQVTSNVVSTIDNMLNIPESTYEDVTPQTTSGLVASYEQQLTFATSGFNQSDGNVRVLVTSFNDEDNDGIGYSSISTDNDVVDLKRNEDLVTDDLSDTPIDSADVAIWIPEQYTRNATKEIFNVYLNDKLFQSTNTSKQSAISADTDNNLPVVSGLIISAIVIGSQQTTNVFKDPVIVSFSPFEPIDKNDKVECVFWDFQLNNGLGEWSAEGCVYNGTVNGRIICHCNHLTNFAVLVSYNPSTQFALDLFSKIGCGISSIALAVGLLTILCVPELRKLKPYRVLINLCVSLLALYIVFLAGIEQTNSPIGCAIVTGLLQFFVVASLMWTSAEGMNMYYLIVLTRVTIMPKFILKASIICWGLPAFIVAYTQAIIYLLEGKLLSDNQEYCFFEVGGALIAGVLAPSAFIMAFNMMIFFLVMRRQCNRPRSSLSESTAVKRAIQHARIIIPVSLLLGLTWAFGFLAIGESTLIFQYIFCGLNSFTGLFIFVWFVVRQRSARAAWVRCMFCETGERRSTRSASVEMQSNSSPRPSSSQFSL